MSKVTIPSSKQSESIKSHICDTVVFWNCLNKQISNRFRGEHTGWCSTAVHWVHAYNCLCGYYAWKIHTPKHKGRMWKAFKCCYYHRAWEFIILSNLHVWPPPISNHLIPKHQCFPVKALQLKPLVNNHLL